MVWYRSRHWPIGLLLDHREMLDECAFSSASAALFELQICSRSSLRLFSPLPAPCLLFFSRLHQSTLTSLCAADDSAHLILSSAASSSLLLRPILPCHCCMLACLSLCLPTALLVPLLSPSLRSTTNNPSPLSCLTTRKSLSTQRSFCEALDLQRILIYFESQSP